MLHGNAFVESMQKSLVIRGKNIPFDLVPSSVFSFYACLFELVCIIHIISYPQNPLFSVLSFVFVNKIEIPPQQRPKFTWLMHDWLGVRTLHPEPLCKPRPIESWPLSSIYRKLDIWNIFNYLNCIRTICQSSKLTRSKRQHAVFSSCTKLELILAKIKMQKWQLDVWV